jgi:hypothetical protein
LIRAINLRPNSPDTWIARFGDAPALVVVAGITPLAGSSVVADDALQTPARPFEAHISQEMSVDASEFPLEFRLYCQLPRESPPCGDRGFDPPDDAQLLPPRD